MFPISSSVNHTGDFADKTDRVEPPYWERERVTFPLRKLTIVIYPQWGHPETMSVILKAIENVFRVCIAWYKHERGWENSRQLCKPETNSRVPVENSLSIRRFWGKRGKMETKKGDSWRRETPDTDAFTGTFHPHTAWFDTIQSKSHPVIGLSASRVKKLA